MWNIPNVVAVAGQQRQQLPEGGNGKSVPMSVGIIPRFAVLACVRVRNMPVTSSRFSYGLFWGDRTGAQGKQTMIPRKGLNLSFYDHTNCVYVCMVWCRTRGKFCSPVVMMIIQFAEQK